MNKYVLATSLVLALASASSAQAETIDRTLNINATVNAFCTFTPSNSDITTDLSGFMLTATANESFSVICNEQLPYTIETESEDGVFALENADGDLLYAQFHSVASGMFGSPSIGQGENAYQSIGTGAVQYVPYSIRFNVGQNGEMKNTRAAIGDYTATQTVSLTY